MNNVKVLSIMTTMRSGSKLFHSLLDRHPQIVCFPRTLQFDNFWRSVAHKNNDLEYMVDSFIEKHPRFFSGECWHRFNKYDRADQLGPERNETFFVDAGIFKRNALAKLKDKQVDRRTLFLALHLAYHAACGRPLLENSVFLYHIHEIDLEDELKACLSDFPDSRVLIMTRQPIEGLNSCVKQLKMQNTLSCNELLHHQRQALEGTANLMEHFPGLNIKILPFEQLHIRHKEVMEAFAKWVDIDWDDNLMHSTMHGKLWWSNGKVPRNGTNPGWKVYQPSGLLEKKDWVMFRSIAPERYVKYGYVDKIEDIKKVQGRRLLFLLLLPTAYEWTTLKYALSIPHWMTVLRDIVEELRDPRLKDYDYYTKKEIPKDKRTSSGFNPGDSLIFTQRLFRLLWMHFQMLNVFIWPKYVLKRSKSYYKFAKRNKERPEKLPSLLLEGIYPARREA